MSWTGTRLCSVSAHVKERAHLCEPDCYLHRSKRYDHSYINISTVKWVQPIYIACPSFQENYALLFQCVGMLMAWQIMQFILLWRTGASCLTCFFSIKSVGVSRLSFIHTLDHVQLQHMWAVPVRSDRVWEKPMGLFGLLATTASTQRETVLDITCLKYPLVETHHREGVKPLLSPSIRLSVYN